MKSSLVESVNSVILSRRLSESPNSMESKIYDVLMSYDFDDWYEKDFHKHIVGDEKSPDKEQILKDIKAIFRV